MIATTGTSESCRFSAGDLRPTDRLPFYRDMMDRAMEKADIEAAPEGFSFDTTVYRLPDLRITYTAASPTRVNRPREVADASEQFFLMMFLEGAATISQLHKEETVSAGGSILFSGAAPLRINRTMSRFFLIGIPRAVLGPMIANPGAALMSVIPRATKAVPLLTGYLDAFVKEPMIEGPQLRAVVVHHVHDLVAMAVGATRDAAEVASGRGMRAARIRAIKADIAQNLDGDVSADVLAARHRVSPRYIRKLFEGENTSLSQWVLGQRLVRVHRMLTDPRWAHFTIGAIAFDSGFGDLSTFNRHFRRHFGVPPSDVRAAAPREALPCRTAFPP